jgi:hypothetical protein
MVERSKIFPSGKSSIDPDRKAAMVSNLWWCCAAKSVIAWVAVLANQLLAGLEIHRARKSSSGTDASANTAFRTRNIGADDFGVHAKRAAKNVSAC